VSNESEKQAAPYICISVQICIPWLACICELWCELW